MGGSDKKHPTSGGRKRKRLPVFSIVLISCYLVISVLVFAYGIREGPGRTPASAPVEPTTPVSTEEPAETPTPEIEQSDEQSIPLPPAIKVKGIWVGAWYAGDKAKMDNYIDLIDRTELNAIVLDVKEEYGHVTFLTDNELISGTAKDLIPNIAKLLDDLNSRGIYPIARVVCFKDPIRASQNPHCAILDKNGNQWRDKGDTMWIDPYKRENWEYIAEVCLEAARLGFKEIQLDYVRFPVEGKLSDIDYGQAGELQTRAEVISEFVGYIRDTMHHVGVRTSVDVFAISGISESDSNYLGQDVRLLLPNLDAISPMIYPSHFANEGTGPFGNGVGSIINGELFKRPALEPYGVVYNTLAHFSRLFDGHNPNNAVMRPFIQNSTDAFLGEGFYITYGAEEVRAQIDAVYDAGFEEWLVWNNVSVYSEDAFLEE